MSQVKKMKQLEYFELNAKEKKTKKVTHTPEQIK